jgi:recombination protein RecA
MAAPRKREKIVEVVETPNIYFTNQKIEFVSTGCTKFDCDLGGGYVLGRCANIVGDKSTAKTALATEAVINFLRQYPGGAAFYRETEAAFLTSYAAGMGLPLDKVEFGDPAQPVTTVEEFARELDAFVDKRRTSNTPGIYILDSLDALSDEAEMERDIGKGSYGTQKAAKMSELFRTVARKLERTRVLLIVVSQVRDKIGIMFGEKHTRSGGRALDFYSSQIIWLSKLKDLTREIKTIKRSYGVIVKAKIKKNKISMPGRETEFEFHFGFGVEDFLTSYNFLQQVKRLPEKYTELNYEKMSDKDYREVTKEIGEDVKKVWADIEKDFAPQRKKYL